MPCSKLPAVGAPHREQAQERVDVGGGDRTPIRPPGHRGQNPAGARRLGLPGGGPAEEQAPPALGVAGPGRVVGTADEHVVDGRAVGRAAPGALAPRVLGEKARRDLVLAGRQRQPHLEGAAALVRLFGVEVGVQQAYARPVEPHVELRGRHARRAAPANPYLNRVLGVEGKVVPKQDAAAFVGRQSVDLLPPARRAVAPQDRTRGCRCRPRAG